MNENVQLAPLNEKENNFFRAVTKMGFRVIADEFEGGMPYDPMDDGSYIMELAEEFIIEIERNHLLYGSAGKQRQYLTLLEKRLGKLLADYPIRRKPWSQQFYEFAIETRDQILREIDLLENRQPDVNKDLTLASLFEYPSKSTKIMDILVEQGLVESGTGIWRDETSGYKSLLARLIKDLHFKGYFKNKPTNEQIVTICENTFRCSVKIDTVKQARTQKPESKYVEFKFIPCASTVT